MKHHRRLFSLAIALLLVLVLLPGAAMAADPDAPKQAQAVPPPAAVYPAEVRASEENGVHRLEKVYYLTARDDPAAIPTEDFDREGLHYTLLDVLKTDLTETDSKDYVEVITLESATKDVGEIIKTLEPELEVVTEDGYSGILTPDYTKINVEAAGYKTNSWTVSAKRTYPNLSDADVSLIPKSIEDGGRTLTLADVDWKEANTDYVDGDALAVHYTAVASYTGTATGRSVTGYTVTVDYSGEVSKSSSDTVIYTAVFSAENTSHGETHLEDEETRRELSAEAEQPESTARKIVFLILAALLALAIIGYGGWRGYKYIRDKKRGYV
ncbi:MAG: hypothetical protein IJQ98_01900 [Oscillospiraceae bacterium]|nr:hypothetical protein [Oscillospiraceae bacterium]